MILNNISIVNYRNIKAATLDFSPKMNCFIGHNGAGKTNVLDAIYYLSFCRSAQNPIDSQVITHGEDFFVIDGSYDSEMDAVADCTDEAAPVKIYVGMKRGTKKHFKRNKKEYKRLSDHIGLIPLVMVSPADTLLIDGGSEERRRLMDMVISQYDHSYLDALNGYNRALQQRNTLLKMDEEPEAELLDLWEEQMAANGETIFAKRTDFVHRLTPLFMHFYQTVAGNGEKVGVSYVSHGQWGPLLDGSRRDRFKERAVGYSLHGVHRDDLVFTLNGEPLKREGSQGQHKTFVISLKLAQFDFLKRVSSHTTPLLLLDDIFDKLDAQRVAQIVKLVSGDNFGQIFITDTNREHLDNILKAYAYNYRMFKVSGGEVDTYV